MSEPRGGAGDRTAAMSREERALVYERLRKKKERSADSPARIPRLAVRPDPLPLSFAQQRLWFLDRLTPGDPTYNIPVALAVAGPLSVPALEVALSGVVSRHESLRTTFAESGGTPAQRIAPPGPVPLPVADLSGLPAPSRTAELRRLVTREARLPFDLARGPLLRPTLLRSAPTDHALLLTMHHIVSDAWSSGILVAEVAALYRAAVEGVPAALPDLPIQYADFAVWQRAWLQGEVLGRQLAYWRERLAGRPARLELPTDRPRSAAAARGGLLELELPAHLLAGLKRLAQQEGGTLFTVLLAAWWALLGRWSGQSDLVVGTSIANRNRAETAGLIGFFVNVLPLRADLDGDPPFRALASQARQTALAAYAHQDLPFERLVEELRPEREAGRPPIFQTMLSLLNAPAGAVELPGLHLEPLPTDSGAARFDLTLILAESGRGIAGSLEYDLGLFDRETAERLIAYLRNLLASAVASPDLRLSELPLMDDAEREQVLVEWNRTAAAYPRDSTLPALFAEQAALRPRAVAISWADGEWTYAELALRAGGLARRLSALGVGPEVPVALLAERSPAMVAALLGILGAGGFYVPLDPGFPAGRLALLLEDSGAAVLVGERRLLAELPASVSSRVLEVDLDEALAGGEPEEEPFAIPTGQLAESLAYAMYTSGSTGRPKGVWATHRNVVRLVRGADYAELGPEEAFLQYAPLSFDASTLEIWAPLLNGGRLVLAPAGRLSLADLGEAVERGGVTSLWLTAGLFHQMVEAGLPGFGRVEQLLAGGDVLSALHVRRALQALPGCRVIDGYGPTEGTTFTCCHGMSSPKDVGDTVPIGRPIANARAYVLDRDLSPVPAGVWGELYAGGDGLARGYLGRPERTAERFVPDPFGGTSGAGEAGGRLYRTGDVVRWRRDGVLEFQGRRDGQVKVRGFRVELGEVESALLGHPGVREAVALVREDRPGDRRLVGYVAAREGAGKELAEELLGRLRERLPEPLVPSAVVVLDSLPLTANGKVDRGALPAPEAGGGEEAYVAPATEIERRLVEVSAEVLGLDPARVSLRDGFFGLGGHSLLGTQLVVRLEERYGIELPLQDIFDARDLGDLAGRIAARERPAAEARVEVIPRLVVRPAPLPLSFAQQRLWFLDRLMPGDPTYNIPLALAVEGPLSPPAMASALAGVVARHEALRTTFAEMEAGPAQVIAPRLSPELPVADLAGLPAALRDPESRRLAREEARRPFDLARGPLVRATLLRRGPADHLLLATMHHIVSDGWSSGILVAEVAAFYQTAVQGMPAPPWTLAELPIQYADFAVWQRGWLRGEVLERQLAYWREQLARRPEALELPADRPRAASRTFRGGMLAVDLPESLVVRLEEVARGEGATLFMVLLAAYQTLLGRLSGQRDLAVGSPIANRNRAETAGLIGFFVNTLVLRSDLAGDPPFRALVAAVRGTALGAYAHQDLPFERLVEELNPERSLAVSPLFQVMLSLQNAPAAAVEIPGLRFVPFPVDLASARFDLTLLLAPAGGGLAGGLEYDADLFDRTTAARWIGHFRRLLEGAAADPGRRLSELPLLAESERVQLLVEWSRKAAPYPREATLAGLFAEQAALRPLAPAVSWEGGELTYGELARRAAGLARRLSALGVGPEVPVALLAERSPEAIVALLGILLAGGFYVPLDPASPAERLALLLADSGARVLLGDRRLLAALPSGMAPVEVLELDALAAPAGDDGTPFAPPADLFAESLAYAMYTSGSTGRPKGVWATHRNVVRLVRGADYARLGPEEVFLQYAPLSFDASTLEIWAPLLNGGRLTLAPPGHLSLADLGAAVERAGVTSLWLTAGLFHQAVEAGLPGFGSVRQLLAGGDVLSPSHVRRALAALPSCRVIDGYGPTEGTTFTCCHAMASPEEVGVNVPIGRPIANTGAYVLDEDFSLAPRLVPMGVWGELYAAGDGLARGYLGRPELTAERFVPDPFGGTAGGGETGGRLYRTGDIVRWRSDGTLEFQGRRDGQVKVRGFRVEPAEVEAVLLGCPGVRQAVVGVRTEAAEGSGKRLVAWVVPDGEPSSEAAAGLRAYLLARLPEPMVPSLFVPLAALPLTANGKVDRAALPDPDPAAARTAELVAPRTAVEELVAGLWAEVLGVEPGRVGVHDSFFELGGHSLLGTRLVSRIQGMTGVDLPLRCLFESPTLEAFAATILAHEPKPGQVEKIARVVQRVRGMSAEAKRAALGRAPG